MRVRAACVLVLLTPRKILGSGVRMSPAHPTLRSSLNSRADVADGIFAVGLGEQPMVESRAWARGHRFSAVRKLRRTPIGFCFQHIQLRELRYSDGANCRTEDLQISSTPIQSGQLQAVEVPVVLRHWVAAGPAVIDDPAVQCP